MSVTVLHFFQKSILSKLRVRKAPIFRIRGPVQDLKITITSIPLVPQKTVKYKSCSYWCPETFIKVWQGLKIDILEFILKKLIFGWILDAILDFSLSVSEIVTKNFFQNFFGALDIFGRDYKLSDMFTTESVSSAYLYLEKNVQWQCCVKRKIKVSYSFAFLSKINIFKVTGPKGSRFWRSRTHARPYYGHNF